MSNKIDLTGKTFGELKALKENGRGNNRSFLWLCKCSCGNFKTVNGIYLRHGNTKSCGCLLHKSPQNKLDLTNKIFGRLKVTKWAGKNK